MDCKMTELEESIERLTILTENKICDTWQSVDCDDVQQALNEIERLNKVLLGRPSPPHELFQLLIILEKHLDRGDKLKKQGANWHLFKPDGEGSTSAHTIYGLLMNSYFMKLTEK